MRILTLLLLAASLATPCFADVPTLEQAIESRWASSPKLSPDGRHVAYHIRQVDWAANAFIRQIWIHDTKDGRSYQLTAGKTSAGEPEWSPDGKHILFSANREEKQKLYIISPFGGEAVALTDGEMSVSDYAWSPDGLTIAFLSQGGESKEREERKKKYGEFERVDRDYRMTHLWTFALPYPIPTDPKLLPKPSALTTGTDFTVNDFEWSPNGAYIAFGASVDPDPDNGHTSDLYTVRLSDLGVKRIVSTKGPEYSPRWSPDGKQIAFITAAGKEKYYYLNSEIALVPAEGGEVTILTSAFDEYPWGLVWHEAGLYFLADQRTQTGLFHLDPTNRDIERINAENTMAMWYPAFSRDGATVAFLGAAPNDFFDIHISKLDSFHPRRVTQTGAQFKDYQLASREVISWKSTDGVKIEGVLIKPPDFDATRKYPLLVQIHGGPTGVSTPQRTPDRYYPIERFVAKGAVVLQPNYRGSAGYGEKFRSLNVKNLGVGDAWDVISGVDHLIALGFVDKERVGTMGWSQGGYISAFLTCSSDRFRAASVGAGISNWTTYYVNTDIHPFTRQYLHATPWEDPEIYRKTSPISYVNKAQTPTLIQHGEKDNRVPLPNAYELYQALRDKKVPVRLTVYKGFGHGISKPKELLHVAQENYDWFSEHIWGEKPKADPEPAGK